MIRHVRRGSRAVVALAVALALVGCDLFGPSGPGALEATVGSAVPLGALVLELDGGGVTGFEGRGSTRAYGNEVTSTPSRHRVVLVSADDGPLRFAILVEERGAERPSLRVVSAVGPGNRPVHARDIEVRVD